MKMRFPCQNKSDIEEEKPSSLKRISNLNIELNAFEPIYVN